MSLHTYAKVFWTGRSQAVRLPKEFRFDTDEVSIRREGDKVVLEPMQKREWPAGYFAALKALGPISLERPSPLPASPYRDRMVEEWSSGLKKSKK